MKPDLHLTIAIAQLYAEAASLLRHSKTLAAHDREKELRLTAAARRRISTAREDVKMLGHEAQKLWAHVDRHAALGHQKETNALATEIVQGVRAHVS